VFAALALRFGDPKSLQNLGDIPSMTTEILMRGTSKHTRQEIQDELTAPRRVNINTWALAGLPASRPRAKICPRP
jgi:hypothetical protein